jgi:hypothetical protein
MNVRDSKIEYGARMIEFGILGGAQHEPDTAAVEKGECWGCRNREMAHAQDISIKLDRLRNIVDSHGDLTDLAQLQRSVVRHKASMYDSPRPCSPPTRWLGCS